MNPVKQNTLEVRLRSLMSHEDGWGVEQGREVHHRLLAIVENHPATDVFRIFLSGVRRTDVSFPRESVVELAKRYRGHKGFCLWDVTEPNILENWDAAAAKREQPILVWNKERANLIGRKPTKGTEEVFEIALKVDRIRAAAVAEKLNMKISNASNKLRSLAEEGYLLRRDETAPSGGIEYVYYRIK